MAVKYLHPRPIVTDKYPNATAQQRCTNLTAVKRETKKVNRRDQKCIFFTHDDFPDKELHSVERWVRVDKEENDNQFFDDNGQGGEEEVHNGPDGEQDGIPIPQEVFNLERTRGTVEDIANVHVMGFGVNDDNKPAPENIPVPNLQVEQNEEGWLEGQEWGWNGFCHRKREGGIQERAKLNTVASVVLESIDMVKMFLLFFFSEVYRRSSSC